MIIDAHVHLAPSRDSPLSLICAVRDRYRVDACAPGTPENYLALAERAGIDAAVVVSFPPTHGLITAMNKFSVGLSRGDAGHGAARFLPLVSLVPDAPELSEPRLAGTFEALLSAGMRGMKLHPIWQLRDPRDPSLRPAYRLLSEHHLPLLAHSGISSLDGDAGRNAEPMNWDPVLCEFPDLVLILAHMGGGLWEEAHLLASRHPKVHFDTSGMLTVGFTHAPVREHEAIVFMRSLGIERFLFGSDYPWHDPGGDATRIRALPLTALEKEMILGGNAVRVFGCRGGE